ncbi:Rdx family domain-containing protein [Trichoderma novae-zelandiae]
MASSAPSQHEQAAVTAPLPRITIQFCTQCKWMLRAAYYAQELLSTFSLSIGEVALQPSTGGTFIVTIHSTPTSDNPSPSSSAATPSPDAAAAASSSQLQVQSTILWDRKTDGGFPETKDLKRRVRDVIEPGRHLGHVDRDHRRPSTTTATTTATAAATTTAAAATSAPAATQETTQETAPATAAAAAAAAAAKEDTARQDEKPQDQASSGIVCEDCS